MLDTDIDIELEGVWKTYDSDAVAVRDLSLRVRSGTTLCLIGTSGSGKTTTLKMLNRLIEPTKGIVRIGGEDVRSQDPIALRRSIGYVVQRGGLFGHMTIAENVGIVAKLERWSRARIDARVDELLEFVSLPAAEYRDRRPQELSGGQQQRVGIARALMVDPPLILMDEPFGALDPITREGLQQEFLRMSTELDKTIVIVTHDLAEAFALADRVAIMDGGALQQVGAPTALIADPSNDFVRAFVKTHAPQRSPADLVARDVMTDVPLDASPFVPAIHEGAPLGTVLDEMFQMEVESLPVVDDDGYVIGGVHRSELIAFFGTQHEDDE